MGVGEAGQLVSFSCAVSGFAKEEFPLPLSKGSLGEPGMCSSQWGAANCSGLRRFCRSYGHLWLETVFRFSPGSYQQPHLCSPSCRQCFPLPLSLEDTVSLILLLIFAALLREGTILILFLTLSKCSLNRLLFFLGISL